MRLLTFCKYLHHRLNLAVLPSRSRSEWNRSRNLKAASATPKKGKKCTNRSLKIFKPGAGSDRKRTGSAKMPICPFIFERNSAVLLDKQQRSLF